MSDLTLDLWFKRKTYGWGWAPATWQGWLVFLVWIIFFYLSLYYVRPAWLNNLLIFFSIVVLFAVCYLKGEKPRWQWGKRA